MGIKESKNQGDGSCLLVGHGVTNSGEHLAQLRLRDSAVVLSIEKFEGSAGILVLLLRGGEFLLVEALEGGKVNVVIYEKRLERKFPYWRGMKSERTVLEGQTRRDMTTRGSFSIFALFDLPMPLKASLSSASVGFLPRARIPMARSALLMAPSPSTSKAVKQSLISEAVIFD